jgi:hypothetical protein
MRTYEQLRALFRECCSLLPVEDLSKIQRLWQNASVQSNVPVDHRPLILRVRVITIQEGDSEPVENPGSCALTDGIRFWFKSIVVDEAPDEILRTMIVHELGHALRAAEWIEMPPGNRPAQNKDNEECAADALCEKLDFDLRAMRTWLFDNRQILGMEDS